MNIRQCTDNLKKENGWTLSINFHIVISKGDGFMFSLQLKRTLANSAVRLNAATALFKLATNSKVAVGTSSVVSSAIPLRLAGSAVGTLANNLKLNNTEQNRTATTFPPLSGNIPPLKIQQVEVLALNMADTPALPYYTPPDDKLLEEYNNVATQIKNATPSWNFLGIHRLKPEVAGVASTNLIERAIDSVYQPPLPSNYIAQSSTVTSNGVIADGMIVRKQQSLPISSPSFTQIGDIIFANIIDVGDPGPDSNYNGQNNYGQIAGAYFSGPQDIVIPFFSISLTDKTFLQTVLQTEIRISDNYGLKAVWIAMLELWAKKPEGRKVVTPIVAIDFSVYDNGYSGDAESINPYCEQIALHFYDPRVHFNLAQIGSHTHTILVGKEESFIGASGIMRFESCESLAQAFSQLPANSNTRFNPAPLFALMKPLIWEKKVSFPKIGDDSDNISGISTFNNNNYQFIVSSSDDDSKIYMKASADGNDWTDPLPIGASDDTTRATPAFVGFQNNYYVAYRGKDTPMHLNVLWTLNPVTSNVPPWQWSWGNKVTFGRGSKGTEARSPDGPTLYNDEDKYLFLVWSGAKGSRIRMKINVDNQNWSKNIEVGNANDKTSNTPSFLRFKDKYYVAWRGMDNDHLINVISTEIPANQNNTDVLQWQWNWGNKVTFGINQNNIKFMKESLAFSGVEAGPTLYTANNLLYLLWINGKEEERDDSAIHSIGLKYTSDGVTWSTKRMMEFSSHWPCGMSFFRQKHFMAWKNKNKEINIANTREGDELHPFKM